MEIYNLLTAVICFGIGLVLSLQAISAEDYLWLIASIPLIFLSIFILVSDDTDKKQDVNVSGDEQ